MKKLKPFLLAFLFSGFMIALVTRAATPYTVTEFELNDEEFPRVQLAIGLDGSTEGLLGKHIAVKEGGRIIPSPMVFLPPNTTPEKIDLHILVDSSQKTLAAQSLIRSNLKGLVTYFLDHDIDLQVSLSAFQDGESFTSQKQEEIMADINNFSFSQTPSLPIAGFERIVQEAQTSARPEAQKVMVVVSASRFTDQRNDGVTGSKAQQAIAALAQNNYLTFFMGQPFGQLHTLKSQAPLAEQADVSHYVTGGYLGGFGADLSSLAQLILNQSPEHFLLQYYSLQTPSSFGGATAELWIEDYLVHDFSYQAQPSAELTIDHLPDNELAVGGDVSFELDVLNESKALNAVELYYKNPEGTFSNLPLTHEREQSSEQGLHYSVQLPSDILQKDYFSYYLQTHTAYQSGGSSTPLFTLPVNLYDDGIILTATLLNEKEVLWSWSGPTVEKGENFELWFGDELITTTDQLRYIVPVEDCDRYQIMQVKVIFPDGTKSYPSRPYEFYAHPEGDDPLISEQDSVELMLRCLESIEAQPYIRVVKTLPGFHAQHSLTLERAGLYMSEILGQNPSRDLDLDSGYYSLLHYLMNFVNKEQYLDYGRGVEAVKTSIIYKFISKANHTEDLVGSYAWALNELSSRLRGQLTF